MTPQEARILMNKIRDNRDKLDACPAHDFGDVPLPFTFGMTFTCLKCKGDMKAVDAFRYIQGYEAAGGNPNKVMQGYNPEWQAPPKPVNEACNFCLSQASKANTENEALRGLLDEVASSFTRHDDLPNNLLPRIDQALAKKNPSK